MLGSWFFSEEKNESEEKETIEESKEEELDEETGYEVEEEIEKEEERTESSDETIDEMQDWGNKTAPRKDLALIVVGILFLIISPFVSGVSFVSAIFLYLGIIFIGAGLYLVLKRILRKEQVLDSWSMLIENGQGRFNKVFQDTESFIKESKAPSLET